MEPSSVPDWQQSHFVPVGKITFAVRKDSVLMPAEMLAAVVLADREWPWFSDGNAARLNVRQPELIIEDDTNMVYEIVFQPGHALIPSQLAAYTRHVAKLAEAAFTFIRLQGDIIWTGGLVDFQGTTMLLKTK